MLELVIGNRNYSSWSLRPWFLLKALGIPFIETRVPLFEADSARRIAAVSPSGKLPVLREGPLVVWESLAILETLAERHPAAWPADPGVRAHARSVATEMHGGFGALRSELPMNCRARRRIAPTAAAQADIARVHAIWRECRAHHGAAGPWLFGAVSVADAMYAPVVTRFATYDVRGDASVEAYVAQVLGSPPLAEWLAGAASETETIAKSEIGTPV